VDLLKLLLTLEVIRRGHFVFTDDDHGNMHIKMNILLQGENRQQFTEIVRMLVEAIRTKVPLDPNRPVVFIGPESVGAELARDCALEFKRRMPSFTDVRWEIFEARKTLDGDKEFIWGAGCGKSLTPRTQVIWVDDVYNAGSTLRRTRKMIEDYGPITAVAVIANRGNLPWTDSKIFYFISLCDLSLPRYSEVECPLCKDNVPINLSPGHGERFQQRKPNYKGGFI